MRVSIKIIVGFAVLLGLTCIGLAYQVSVIHQMQSINKDLSAINLHAASVALRNLQLGQTLEEFSLKYFVTEDPIYERQLDKVKEEFRANLTEMRDTVRSDREHTEVERMFLTLDEYSAALAGH